jgi:hypothetical protein
LKQRFCGKFLLLKLFPQSPLYPLSLQLHFGFDKIVTLLQ